MADLCTCGHALDDWCEHTYDPTEDRYVCLHPAFGASGWRARSPLSAFRGMMRWTRLEAARALVSLFRGYEEMAPSPAPRNERVAVVWLLSRAASSVARWGARRLVIEARRMLVAARSVVVGGEDVRGAWALLTAARILRATAHGDAASKRVRGAS